MSSKDYFNKVAKQWDSMRAGFFSEEVREKAIAIADAQPGKLAVDVGSGTGFVTDGLVQKGLRVIAVDPSEVMLEEMKRKFKEHNSIDYRVGQAESLPISDNTADYVFANMCLHHTDSPPKAIKEMARILKKGGGLIITDLDEHTYDVCLNEHHDRWMGFKREDVKRWFIDASLNNIETDCVGECCEQSSCINESVVISIFIVSGNKT